MIIFLCHLPAPLVLTQLCLAPLSNDLSHSSALGQEGNFPSCHCSPPQWQRCTQYPRCNHTGKPKKISLYGPSFASLPSILHISLLVAWLLYSTKSSPSLHRLSNESLHQFPSSATLYPPDFSLQILLLTRVGFQHDLSTDLGIGEHCGLLMYSVLFSSDKGHGLCLFNR